MCVTKLPFDWYTTLDTSDNIGVVERLLNDLNPELLKRRDFYIRLLMTIFQFLMLYGLKLEIEPFMTRKTRRIPTLTPYFPTNRGKSEVLIQISLK